MPLKFDIFLNKIRESDSASITTVDSQRKNNPFFWSDFLTNNSASQSPFWFQGVSSGSCQPGVGTDNHPGVAVITASAGGNSGGYMGTNNGEGCILLKGGEKVSAIFKIPSFANITSFCGFADNASSGSIVDGVFLIINTSGVVAGKTSNNSTVSTTGTTFQMVADTWYELSLLINVDATLVTYRVHSDSGELLWSDTLSTNIPKTTGRELGAGVSSLTAVGGVVGLLYLDYLSVSLGTIARGS